MGNTHLNRTSKQLIFLNEIKTYKFLEINKMRKLIFAICLCIAPNVFAKTYGVVIEVCLLGTNCQGACVDRALMDFTVDELQKTVTLTGQSVAGDKKISQVEPRCTVSDVDNWDCPTSFMRVWATKGLLSLKSVEREHGLREHEICWVK